MAFAAANFLQQTYAKDAQYSAYIIGGCLADNARLPYRAVGVSTCRIGIAKYPQRQRTKRQDGHAYILTKTECQPAMFLKIVERNCLIEMHSCFGDTTTRRKWPR